MGFRFHDATCTLFDLRYNVPQGIASILISRVNHPLSGSAGLISRLKRKSISWVCVTEMKNSDGSLAVDSA